ncbi:MAG TPA: family 78 glycoside hydrolase catalytic domain [Opitutaceae bacterium]|nr:family 78 glycoside hydrolase catalytic domain [Opitutaceae bacterium]
MSRIPCRRLIVALTLPFAVPLVSAAPTKLVTQSPQAVTEVAPGVFLADFGRVAFGNLRLLPPAGATGAVTVHFGEALKAGRIDRQPGGTIRYARATTTLAGPAPLVVAPAADARNTKQPAAVLTPADWGVVLPFRWVEIEGWPGPLHQAQLERRAAFALTWQDDAAAFHCDDATLNGIWELCRYSIKATTFAGVYVDGDRERIPYEADAYLNQLSHYACDPDPTMARDTFDRLLKYPTWPTEWAAHVIFMAQADWMQTGDTAWLAARYDALQAKLLLDRARPDGLLVSTPAQIKQGDIVDWPVGERDGFVFSPVNSVVNAFHLRAVALLAELARALHRNTDAAALTDRLRSTGAAFQREFFDPVRGVYRDGIGTDHASLHANLFPLAFGLVPPEHRASVVALLRTKGMACSVYAAQYLLAALFENDAADAALALIAAPGDRSWRHMLESGTTITWEAWDNRYKPNQDWNHAWGTAPANLLPRYVLGVSALAPGWMCVRLRPHPGALTRCEGRVPTPRGPVDVRWQRGAAFTLSFTLPPGTTARLELPATGQDTVTIDGQPAAATRAGPWLLVAGDWSAMHTVEVR